MLPRPWVGAGRSDGTVILMKEQEAWQQQQRTAVRVVRTITATTWHLGRATAENTGHRCRLTYLYILVLPPTVCATGASSCQHISSFICEMGLMPDLQGSYENRRLASLLSFAPIANQTLAALRLILKLGQNT